MKAPDRLDFQRVAILQSIIDKHAPGIKHIATEAPELQLVVDLLDRYFEERRSHWEPDIGEAWHPDEWRERLRGRFPGLDCGFDHGPGWHDLLAAGAQMAADAGEPLRISYVKEKFGRMSAFMSSVLPIEIAGIDEAMELLSEHICEECGAPGQNRPHRYWFRTECDAHYAERQR